MGRERNPKLATTHLFRGAFGSQHGYSRLPGNKKADKEHLKLLPELRRIRLSQIKYLFSLDPKMKQLAAEKGIDMFNDDDEEAFPEELKQYWACFRAQDKVSDLIDHLEAQQGGWLSVNKLFK
ncbi:hypothetical protein COCOBI_16-1610 [Coccomyxa sp. Obi]|nr:hypothetical protein COCOBI_16-1610 [Coccomyxa sp. Obi]